MSFTRLWKSFSETLMNSAATLMRLSMVTPAVLTPMPSTRGSLEAAVRKESSMPSRWYWGSDWVLGCQTTSSE